MPNTGSVITRMEWYRRLRRLPGVRAFTTSSTTLYLLLLFAACDGSRVPVSPDLGLPNNGRFRGVVQPDSFTTALFTAASTGEADIAICAPEGMEFALGIPGDTVSTAGNCERASFPVVAGRSYRVTVIAEQGAGPFNGCFDTWEFVECTLFAPYPYHPSLPVGYYDATDGRTGTALIDALHEIIDAHEVFSYNDARDSMYASVDDPDNDNIIIDIYTGQAFPNVFNRASALTAGLNAEHTWPQSRGAGELPAQSDLHVLRPVDEDANSARLNYPYGEVVSAVTWQFVDPNNLADTSRVGHDAQGRTVFEPRDSKKGDVARAIFYFYVRYRSEPTASFSLENFNIEEQTLLRWAAEDPVDDYEQERNAIAFRVQGNRNPFVDRDDFLTRIGNFPNN